VGSIPGQGRHNTSALKHGQRSLLDLVRKATDPQHPVLVLVREKAAAYAQDLGGADALSTAEQDVLEHAAVLDLLCRLHVSRIVNTEGRPRRMNATRFHVLALGYARLAEAFARNMSAVGLSRRAKPIPSLEQLLGEPETHDG
jgi:hypothetical protein